MIVILRQSKYNTSLIARPTNVVLILSFTAPAAGGKLHSAYENVRTKDKPSTASATGQQSSSSPRLVVGSRIQIPAKNNSLKYGVIRWIGNLPDFKDTIIAGLEMVSIHTCIYTGLLSYSYSVILCW